MLVPLIFRLKNQATVTRLYPLCKDNANERKENVFSICRVQLILCKDNRLFIYFVLIDLYQHKNFVQSIAEFKVIRFKVASI